MYQVFNMGHRMEVYTDPTTADAVITIAESFGIDAKIIGRTEPAEANRLTLITPDWGDYSLLNHFIKGFCSPLPSPNPRLSTSNYPPPMKEHFHGSN